MEMFWAEFCLKCDRDDDKLLVCSDPKCTVVVHEECMGCPTKFDDSGNFYCPSCIYRQAKDIYRQAKVESRKAREDAACFSGKSPSKSADKSSPEKPEEQLLDRVVEDCGDGHLREIPEREENIMKKAAQMQAGGKENEDGGGAKADQVQENEDGGGAKADQVQGKGRESAASFMNEEHESQLRMKAKRRDETGREFEAVFEGCFGSTETNEIEPQPLNLDSRTAFSPKKVPRLTGETSSQQDAPK